MEKITPDDIRYADLAGKRFNKRFAGKPDYVRLPTSVKEVVEAVQDAVDSKRRLVVRSGGHCLEGFVTDPSAKVLIDMSLMTHIGYDAVFQLGFDNVQAKVKDAFFRQPFTDDQIATAYKYLTANVPIGGGMGMATYGGKVNTVSPEASASAQRDCILDVACNTGWIDPSGEMPSLNWVRNFYKDLFPGGGGVPVPNEQTGGSMINHPDTDLADPEWNQSGVPWYTLYYKDNYSRLQQVKSKWDPLNIFYHALSIKAPE